MSGDSCELPTPPNLHQLCFSLSLCSLSMHTTLWPLSCPSFFLRSAVGLIAKWAVCKYTSTRVSTHRRGPLEGNKNMTRNVTRKIKQQLPTAKTHLLHVLFVAVFGQCLLTLLSCTFKPCPSVRDGNCSSLSYHLPPCWPFLLLCWA